LKTESKAGFAWAEGLRDLLCPGKSNLPSLDVLRSAAILLVFTGHFVGKFQARHSIQNFPVFRWGWTGVDLFFVLSGLLIGSQLWRELSRTGRIRVGHFLLRRGLRIWPLYYAFVAFTILAHFFGKQLTGIWYDVTFLSNFVQGQISGGWSLSTEEQFYIVTPILLLLLALKFSPRRLWIVSPLSILVLVAARIWVSAHSTLPETDLRQKLYYPIITHADGLAVGVFLAWLSVFHKDWLRSKVIVAISAFAMLLCGLALYRANPIIWNFTALGLIFGSLELYGISVLPLPSVVRWRGFHFVSRLSYGLYLNHFIVLELLYPFLYNWSRWNLAGFWIIYAVCLCVSLSVAVVTFLLIEWPFLRIRARWVDRTTSAADGRTR
jgi:peptidoglycan/LPS O-acetylase OafA/YrhL